MTTKKKSKGKTGHRFRFVEIARIKTNPNNPRGINIRENDPKLGLLRDSINKFGILVPLILSVKNYSYLLVDGERRYWAAKDLGLRMVPAFIIRKDLSNQDIFNRMFHIHHNTEPWGALPQCKALESLYSRIMQRSEIKKLKDENVKIRNVAYSIADETGITLNLARDRVLFLRWPKDIKKELYDHPNENYLYINEIEKHIILPALLNYPEYFTTVPVDDVRRYLYRKLESKVVGKKINVREAGPIVKIKMTKIKDRDKVLTIFDELVKDDKLSFEDARDEFFRKFPNATALIPPSPRKLLNQMSSLAQNIDIFDINAIKTSHKRSRASKKDLSMTIDKLIDYLNDLSERLR